MEIVKEYININVRQQENDDFFATGSDWWVRRGVFVMLLSLMAIISLGWFIHYPDLLNARASIMCENSPVRMVVRQTGELEAIFIQDYSQVEKGDLMAVFKSAADWQDVLLLDSIITSWKKTNSPQFPAISGTFRLGEIQSSYSGFLQSWQTYNNSSRNALVHQQTAALNSQTRSSFLIRQDMEAQQEKLASQIDLLKADSARNQLLLTAGLISEAECEKTKIALLQTQVMMDNHMSVIKRNEQETNQYRDNINLGQLQFEDASFTLRLQCLDKLLQLDAQVQQWKLNYLVFSAVKGIVSLPRKWIPGQQVLNAETFVTIIPDNSSLSTYGIAFMPMKNAGKVQLGQSAEIRLENYPYQEFGSLKAKIRYIAPVPEDAAYKIILELDTTTVPAFPLKQEMSGEAWITTSNRNVIERILGRYIPNK